MRYFFISIIFCVLFANKTYATIDTLDAVKDSYIRDDSPNSNYGTLTWLQIQFTSASKKWRALVQFDLSSIPKGAKIKSASLQFYKYNGWWYRSLLIQRATSSWTETGVTWNNQPGVDTWDQYNYTTGSFGTGTLAYDVTDHVKAMTCQEQNFGWVLRLGDETTETGVYINFYSREFTTASQTPKLIIEYYDPIDIEVVSTPALDSTTNDGSIDLTVSGGLPKYTGYTYLWKELDADVTVSTSEDPDSLDAGVYRLKVTDSLNTSFYAYVLVGSLADELSTTIQPDSYYGSDNYMNSNYADSSYATSDEQRISYSSGVEERSLLKLKLYGLPDKAYITQADIILKGKDHHGTGNSALLERITEPICMDCMTWNQMPATTSVDLDTLDASTSSTEDYTVDITELMKFYQDYPDSNYGFMLKLISASGDKRLVYYSSNASTASYHPAFIIKINYPSQYVELKRHLDGGDYYVANGLLPFVYKGEYSRGELLFNVYDDDHAVVASNTLYPTMIKNESTLDGDNTYGDNRFVLNMTCTGHRLAIGYYTLEVINEKDEKFYLRFYQAHNFVCAYPGH